MRGEARARAGDRTAAVGYDAGEVHGEVIGLRKPYGWLLIHAMTPSTRKTMREVGEGGY